MRGGAYLRDSTVHVHRCDQGGTRDLGIGGKR